MLTCGGCCVARFCCEDHQRIASKRDGGLRKAVRHKDTCHLLQKWRNVVKGKETAVWCTPHLLEFLRGDASCNCQAMRAASARRPEHLRHRPAHPSQPVRAQVQSEEENQGEHQEQRLFKTHHLNPCFIRGHSTDLTSLLTRHLLTSLLTRHLLTSLLTRHFRHFSCVRGNCFRCRSIKTRSEHTRT